MYTAFLHSIKLPGYRMGTKFDNDFLAVEQNNYIFYDSDNWPNNPLRNFTLKNSFFGATSIVKNNEKEKWVYSGYEIAFDAKGTWSFG